MKNNQTQAPLADRIFAGSAKGAAYLVLALLLGIIVSLVVGAWPSLSHFGLKFLWTNNWDPVAEEFGAVVPIFGTLVSTLIAMLIAVPVSLGIAIFLTELAPKWLRRPIGTAIEMLAAIPSIIYGMWGLFVFAPWFMESVQPALANTLGNVPGLGFLFAGAPLGLGMLTAGIVLSIMVIPFIASVMRDVFDVVPPMLKESAYGLGATTWEVVWQVVLPFTRTGVVGAVMLGMGRALGETMAITFVIGNATRFSGSLFAPGNSIASVLANEFTEAVGVLHTSALIELGLILFLITTLVLACSRMMLSQVQNKQGA